MSVDGLQIDQPPKKVVGDDNVLIGYESEENSTHRENFLAEQTLEKKNPSELKKQDIKK